MEDPDLLNSIKQFHRDVRGVVGTFARKNRTIGDLASRVGEYKRKEDDVERTWRAKVG